MGGLPEAPPALLQRVGHTGQAQGAQKHAQSMESARRVCTGQRVHTGHVQDMQGACRYARGARRACTGHAGSMQGRHGACTGCTQGMYRACTGHAQGARRVRTGYAQGLHRVYAGYAQSTRCTQDMHRACRENTGCTQGRYGVHAGSTQGARRACRGQGCPLMVGATTRLQQGGHSQAGTQHPSPVPPRGFPLPRVSRAQPWDAHRGLTSYHDGFGDSREQEGTCVASALGRENLTLTVAAGGHKIPANPLISLILPQNGWCPPGCW